MSVLCRQGRIHFNLWLGGSISNYVNCSLPEKMGAAGEDWEVGFSLAGEAVEGGELIC